MYHGHLRPRCNWGGRTENCSAGEGSRSWGEETTVTITQTSSLSPAQGSWYVIHTYVVYTSFFCSIMRRHRNHVDSQNLCLWRGNTQCHPPQHYFVWYASCIAPGKRTSMRVYASLNQRVRRLILGFGLTHQTRCANDNVTHRYKWSKSGPTRRRTTCRRLCCNRPAFWRSSVYVICASYDVIPPPATWTDGSVCPPLLFVFHTHSRMCTQTQGACGREWL